MLLPLITLPPQAPATPIQTYAEARERLERRINRDFDDDAADNRTDLLSRWRVGARFELVRGWKGEVQYQYSQTTSWTGARNFSAEDSNAAVAYAQGAIGGFDATIGRQRINIGQQRLVGAGEWFNVGRSWDAVRLKSGKWDLFAGAVGMSSPRPRYAKLGGLVYGSGPRYTALLVKHDEVPAGDVDLITLNHFEQRKIGPATVQVEAALQGGDNAGKDHEAWAVHARATLPVDSKVSAFVEANAASGGADPDKSETFDQLYPTNHDKYGTADMLGWRNMGELAVGLDVKPNRDTSVRLAYRRFGLQDGKDAWYGFGGAPIRVGGVLMRDATGAKGRDLGSELDLDVSYTLSKAFTLSAGVAFFEPGKFVKGFGPSDGQTWGYVSISGRF